MIRNWRSAPSICIPGSGAVRAEHGSAVTPLSGIFPRAVERSASRHRERPRLIRVSDATAGDADGRGTGLGKPRPCLTAGEA